MAAVFVSLVDAAIHPVRPVSVNIAVFLNSGCLSW